MNKVTVNTGNQGIGLTGVLLIVFIVLKLCGVIQWSWWWVLSPFWIPLVIAISIAVGCLVMHIISKKL